MQLKQHCTYAALAAILALTTAITRAATPMVAGGDFHTVALKEDGTVWAWGLNSDGQLGDGMWADRLTPVQVLGTGGVGALSNITVVAAGTHHTVALKDDGTVWAWGDNLYGQIGDGMWADRLTPVQVLGTGGEGVLSDIVAIASGWFYTVALKDDGTVWAWGENYRGQLGDGTSGNSSTPVQVNGEGGVGWLSNIVAVAAGENHTVALKDDGTVWAWGLNFNGQLGDGTSGNSASKSTPVQVTGLSGVTAVAAGREHTVALKDDGTVWAWGYNLNGQLGDGTQTQTPTPVQAGEGVLSNITAVAAAGGNHTIALKDDGTVWAWGYNGYGQLGDGTETQKLIPVQVTGPGGEGVLSTIIAVTAGFGHTVAVKEDGTVWAWGYNWYGQLGDGTMENKSTPVQVLGAGGDGMLYLLAEVQGVSVTAIMVDSLRNVTLVLDGEAENATVEMSLDLSDPTGWTEVPSNLITIVSENTIQISASAHGSAPAAFFRVRGK